METLYKSKNIFIKLVYQDKSQSLFLLKMTRKKGEYSPPLAQHIVLNKAEAKQVFVLFANKEELGVEINRGDEVLVLFYGKKNKEKIRFNA